MAPVKLLQTPVLCAAWILAATLFVFGGCTATRPPAVDGPGSDRVLEICRQLGTPGSEAHARAEEELQTLATQVTAAGREADRRVVVAAVGKALDSGGPVERTRSLLVCLQMTGGEESIPVVRRLLTDDRFGDAAVRVLEVIGAPAEPVLIEGLTITRGRTLLSVIQALGRIRSRNAVGELLRLGVSDDPGVCASARSALANIGDPRAASLLAAADRSPTDRSPAERGERTWDRLLFGRRLAESGDRAAALTIARELYTGTPGEDQIRAAALELIVEARGAPALEDLLAAMGDSSASLRAAALRLSGEVPGVPATARWIEALGQPHTRGEIIAMLGRRGDTTATGAVVSALRDTDPQVREAAAEALVNLRGAEAAGVLPLLPAPGFVLLAEQLGRFGSAVPAEPFFQRANDPDPGVRRAALKAIGGVGAAADQDRLVALLLSPLDDAEQPGAERSLVSLSLRIADRAARTRRILQAYEGATSGQRAVLLRVLVRLGGTASLATLSAAARSRDIVVREEAIRSLAGWPSIEAADTLLALSRNETSTRVLALRGAVRCVEHAGIPPEAAVRYYERVLAAAGRAEEKRLALGALANLTGVDALKLVVPYLRDDSLGLDAAMAAARLASGKDGGPPDPAARVFIESAVNGKFLAQVRRNFDAASEMNVPPPGFRALFNGRNLDGWKGLVANPLVRSRMTPDQLAEAQARADSVMKAHWAARDGILLFDGKGESLCTLEEYADFEMLVDWKIEKHGDSGIYLRGSPQVQIWDPAQWAEGSGALYNNERHPRKPLLLADRPAGEWNTFRIRMIGDRVTVYLNNVLVTDSVVMENYWDRTIPIFAAGQIELQSHNSPLAFRNIFIRELPRPKALWAGSLFNGKDLAGWAVVGGKDGGWGVENGILFTTGTGGGWLSTERTFDNFELQLDFRLPPGGNSGVFLRSPRQGDPAYTGMEIQVLDDAAPEYAHLQPWQYCGSVYGVEPSRRGTVMKAGEWQQYRIVARGPHLAIHLNDQLIVDTDLRLHMEKAPAHPGLQRRSGYIGLQSHTLRVEYRNIILKELEWNENHDTP